MMNYLTSAAQSGYRPAAHVSHSEGIPPGGVGDVSARSRAQAGSSGVDDGEWSIPWPADDSSSAASSMGAAAAYSVRTYQPQSTGEIAKLARRFVEEAKTAAIAVDEGLYELLAGINLAGDETVMRVQDLDR
ncbi:MAG: hypothetical protein ABWY08_10270, partial [Comamonas sp.]